MRSLVLACVAAAWAGTAQAAPPPVDSEDWQIMHPFAEAITRAAPDAAPTQICCSEADATVVDARTTTNGWQIHFLNDRFPDAPKGWTAVPDAAVLTHWHNPTGAPLVWWYHHYVPGSDSAALVGYIRCFAPPAGI